MPSVGRFISPDTLVPGASNPQAFNRYGYVLGNPLKYTDPSGHAVACFSDAGNGCEGFGPARILQSYSDSQYDQLRQEVALRNFARTHPDYDVMADPFLEDVGRAIMGNAQFQAQAMEPHPDWDRLWGTGVAFGLAAIVASGGTDSAQGPNNGAPAAPPGYNREAFGEWQPGVRNRVIRRDSGECVYCGATDDLTVDHVVSARQKWEEGAHNWSPEQRNSWFNDPTNLVTACRICNSSKGDMDPFEWILLVFTGAKANR